MAEFVEILYDMDMGDTSQIDNLPPPAGPKQPVRLEDLDARINLLAHKDEARVASIANINLAAPGATIDSIPMNPDDRFVAKDQTNLIENGLYIWNGAAVPATRASDMDVTAEANNALIPVTEGSNAGAQFLQTVANPILGTSPIVFATFGTAAPPASPTTPGIAAIATQADVDTGTVTNEFVTPETLANWSGRKLKTSGTIGDGATLIFPITHNFNTLDVTHNVFRISNGRDIRYAFQRVDANTVEFRFNRAPALNAFQYTIIA